MGKTAQNYIGSVKWACTRLGLAEAWRDAEVALALTGAKKRTITFVGEAAKQKFLMTSVLCEQVVSLATHMKSVDNFGLCVILSWQLLLRVQSEAMIL